MIWLFLSVLAVCIAVTLEQHKQRAFRRETRKHVDTTALGERLERELADMAKLKSQVEILKLKAGLR